MKQIHKFTSDEKLKWFGHGEWVEEPDAVYFEHNSIECRCIRIVAFEHTGSVFGGHWCGYIKVPNGHAWNGYSFDYHFDCDVHGGISYGDQEEDDWWIGFDCAHLGDMIPSMERMYQNEEAFKKIRQEHQNRLKKCGIQDIFQENYKNIGYIVEETKKLADQCVELKMADK